MSLQNLKLGDIHGLIGFVFKLNEDSIVASIFRSYMLLEKIRRTVGEIEIMAARNDQLKEQRI